MLEALDIRDGHRVLEIGTGTGYNAALICHRLGADQVFSVDVDAELVDSARARLAALGCHPTLVTTDGVAGLPEHAPYDRIIGTCAVSHLPWAWAEQTRPGGRVLADLKIHAAVGNLVLLHRHHDRLEGRFDSGYATFMHMRTPAFPVDSRPGPARDRAEARQGTTTLSHERLWENPPLWFLLHLHLGGRIAFGYGRDPGTGGPGNVFFSLRDGSWCELSPPDDQGVRQVWEGGPQTLWARIDAGIESWHHHGQPGWNHFGLTVTPHEQTVWLDAPGGDHRWRLV